MQSPRSAPRVAIACGGTGGHLFPGLAIAEELLRRDVAVVLLISPKEVDQLAVRSAHGMEVETLPAVGLTRGGALGFARGFFASYRHCQSLFRTKRPDAVLAMGGFTSAPPILAGRRCGAKTFLHDSNTIPGKANRWLAHVVDAAYVYFHETTGRLNCLRMEVTGMPVRSGFLPPADRDCARMALGLDANRPVLLVTGGSQGASGLNDLFLQILPLLAARLPDLQYIHLTGPADVQKVQAAYVSARYRAVVRPFLTEMELALGAATAAVSRSGASSLAELAATRIPAILVPYPHAADDHQYYNAMAFAETGAAWMTRQHAASVSQLADQLTQLITDEKIRSDMQTALARWHFPCAAEVIARKILALSGFAELAAREFPNEALQPLPQ